MGQFQIAGSGFTYLPDPTAFIPGNPLTNGTYTDGAPVILPKDNFFEVLENCVLVWDCLTQQQYGELHTRWNSNKGNLVAGKVPHDDDNALGSYAQVTTAYFHEPLGEARGGLRFNTRMRISFITWYEEP